MYNICNDTIVFTHSGFAISKFPSAISEYLIRQANDKLHNERKKYMISGPATMHD